MDYCIYICTPWCKRYPLMDKTIKSVLNQTYNNFKWTIIDNSKDFFLTPYFDEFFQRNPELGIYKEKINIIPLRSPYTMDDKNLAGFYKNIAIKLSDAKDDDFILMYDPDDYLEIDALKTINESIKDNSYVEFLTSDQQLIETCDAETGKTLDTQVYTALYLFAKSSINNGLWHRYPYHPLVFKKGPFIDIVGGYSEDHNLPDDICLIRAYYVLRTKVLHGVLCRHIIYGENVNLSCTFKFNNTSATYLKFANELKDLLSTFGIKDFPTVDY